MRRSPAPRPRATPPPPGPASLPTPGATIRDTVLGVGTARRLRRCVGSLGLPEHPDAPPPLVTDAELEGLPRRPRAGCGRWASWAGRAPGPSAPGSQAGSGLVRTWMPCTAWRYTTALGPGHAYSMWIDVAGPVPMTGTDTDVRGRGAVRGSVLGLVRVADGSGPEFDLGELTTYVNDAVLLAPSMLLVPAVTWRGVDESTFEVTLVDAGLRTTSTVTLGDHALPVDVVSEGRAVWRPPDGDLEYARGRFLPASVALHLPASAAARGIRRRHPS